MRIPTLLAFLTVFAALASAQETNLTISAGGGPALVLRISQAAKVTVTGNHTVVQTTNLTLHLWPVANAKTAAEAQPHVADLIKGEFLNFKPSATNQLVIADLPAWHILGQGTEADDGDPGQAEVILFAVGEYVFAACVHGEFDDAARANKPMLAVLQTAKTP